MERIKTLAFWSFMAAVGGMGGYLGSAIKTKTYPLSMIERINLTPEVKPGDPILLAQHVDRRDQCDVIVKRVIRTSTGQRIPVRQSFEDDFGPIGGDKYILPVPTDASAALGPAEMYSKAYSWCGWLDYLKPSEAESWTLRFTFAENTIQEPMPEAFSRIGVARQPHNHKPSAAPQP